MKLETSDIYQMALIASAGLVTVLFGFFLYREIDPEYKIYQKDYAALEKFRSSYTGAPPPPFKYGVKQIVIPSEGGGPPEIDRCISCHVALKYEHFSPTKIARDVNGKIIYDENGIPEKEPNPNYIWKKLDEKIADLKERKEDKEAERLQALKKADVEKVLIAHPLIGGETRPFEYHPVEEYGCTICHGGNGRGLVADRAHGPVFDGTYEETYMGPKPEFLEEDEENNPAFSKAYNAKPSHKLLFQTSPLLVGHLMEAKCVLCHKPTAASWEQLKDNAERLAKKQDDQLEAIRKGYEQNLDAAASLLALRHMVQDLGYRGAIEKLKKQSEDYRLPSEKLEKVAANLKFLRSGKEQDVLGQINHRLNSLYAKEQVLKKQKKMPSSLDRLTMSYQRGEELFFSQGCYACHKISGLSRGGIGPELTDEGLKEPWFIKESIVWPQADLKTSTMPNFKLDHNQIEDLMAFLLAQRPENRRNMGINEKIRLKEWEEGKKKAFEEPVEPSEIRDIKKSMTIFAAEGCAACHRLQGFESNVGFEVEKKNPSFDQLYEERMWFRKLFPEEDLGSSIVKTIDEHKVEIEKRIVPGVRKKSVLDEIEEKNPGLLAAFYSNFEFAKRAKKEDSELVHRVLLMYIQEYGLGRQIGPELSYSGIYRPDQWLMEHFWNPSAVSPRSIMPVFPFDNTKFLALTYMLNTLAQKNLLKTREVWEMKGFNPEEAYQALCSQCHGRGLKGNGPVSEWIYPLPKNLGSAVFLRNLTKERAIDSIIDGIHGTPMPPWGETAEDKGFKNTTPVLKKEEVTQLVNWLYSSLPGERILHEKEDVKKWKYKPEDIEDIFVVAPNPEEGPEPYLYTIKKKHYTEKNLKEGKEFFELNCAICHGKDADGAGLRASVMEEAKPRMLTNLHWLESRDDLRLLRSIHYGVPGTAMVAWGDQTTPLQRLQLVMYIRSLTEKKQEYEKFKDKLFQVFQPSLWALEDDRVSGSRKIRELEKKAHELRRKRKRLESRPEEASALYAKELKIRLEIEQYQREDEKYSALIDIVKKEKDLYQMLGSELFNYYGDSPIFQNFLKALDLSKDQKIQEEILEGIAKNEDELTRQKTLEEGKISGPEQKKKLKEIKTALEKQQNLKKEVIATFSELRRLKAKKTGIVEP